MITDRELAWAAGLFEGEGTIRINKPTKRNCGHLCVSVVNTDIEVVHFFSQRWPGYVKPAAGMRPEQRPAWVWTTAARKAAAFLRDIEPFVVTERVRTKLRHGLWFQDQKTVGRANRTLEYIEAQWNAYWWMCELNTRGVREGETCPQAGRWRRPKGEG